MISRDRRRDTGHELTTRTRGLPAVARLGLGAAALAALVALPPARAALVAIEPKVATGLFLLGAAWFLAGQLARGRSRRALVRAEGRTLRLLDRWGLVLAVLACIAPLLAAWDLRPPSANAAFATLFGRIPWGDAHGHLEGASRLLADGAFSSFSGRRPLNAAWLAVRLWLTGGRLEAALLIQAVLLGASAYAAARVIGRRRGLGPSLAFFGLLLGLTSDYLPSTATEPLGVTLSCAALAVLWGPGTRGQLVPGLLGLWLLVLALGARPGAQFLIPCLGLWVVWTCRPRSGRAALGVAAVALGGTLLSASLNALYGTRDASTSAAAAYPFYGLATGSNYRQIREDLGDELALLPDERARTRLIYRRGWERLRAEPGTAVSTLGRNLRKFAGKTPPVLYHLVSPQGLVLSPWERAEPTAAVQARDRWMGRVLLGFAVLALARYLWRGSGSERLFWLAAIAGVVLSAPVVYGDAGLRGLAASFPFLAGLLTIGLGRGARRDARTLEVESATSRVLGQGAAALVAAALLGPAIAHASATRPSAQALAHPAPETLVVRLRPAPTIVVSNRPRPELDAPALPRRQYLRHLSLANVGASGFDRLDPPFALASVYDHVARRQRVLVVPPEALRDDRFLRVRARMAAGDENLLVVSEWAPVP